MLREGKRMRRGKEEVGRRGLLSVVDVEGDSYKVRGRGD